jgi:hypothetical protein
MPSPSSQHGQRRTSRSSLSSFITRAGLSYRGRHSPRGCRSSGSRRKEPRRRPTKRNARTSSSAYGLFGIARRLSEYSRCLDVSSSTVDELGITLEKCNRTGGWALKVFRVRKDGHYHHGSKITVLFAIELGDPALPPETRGSVERPRRWIRCIQGVGTTTNVFRNFCDHICTEIERFGVDGTDDHRIFIWDNLAAHHSVYVHQTVTGRDGPRRFSIVARPQYHPKYGPIEYKICELTNILSDQKQPDWNMQMLEDGIYQAAMSIKTFDSTFIHCGYRWA